MKFLIEDSNEIVDEKWLREYLFIEETRDLLSNKREYLDGELNLSYQLSCIRKAKYGEIDDIIEMLERNWNVPIKKINESEE